MMLHLTCDLKVKGLNVLQYASKKGATKLLDEMLKTPYVFMNPVTEQFDVTFLIPDSVPEPTSGGGGRATGQKPLSCLELIVNNRSVQAPRCADILYQVRQNKLAPKSFSLFSQQPFGILISNFTHLFSEMFYI